MVDVDFENHIMDPIIVSNDGSFLNNDDGSTHAVDVHEMMVTLLLKTDVFSSSKVTPIIWCVRVIIPTVFVVEMNASGALSFELGEDNTHQFYIRSAATARVERHTDLLNGNEKL